MYLTKDIVKNHLNVDQDFHDDDIYIDHLISACESAVAKRLNLKSLGNLMTDQGYLPDDVTHAVLLLIGNLYANREPVAYGNAVKIPHTLELLFEMNKNYVEPL